MSFKIKDKVKGNFGERLQAAIYPDRRAPQKKINPSLVDDTAYHNVHDWNQDGIDHININMTSHSWLGRTLHPAARANIAHPYFSHFSCVRGFMLWLELKDQPDADELRSLWGANLQKQYFKILGEARSRLGFNWRPTRPRNYEALVAEVVQIVINNNRDLKKAMFENELPYDMYYVNQTGMRSRDTRDNTMWYVNMLSKFSKHLQEGAELPSFLMYMTDMDVDNIYVDVMPKYQLDYLRKMEEQAANKAKAKKTKAESPEPAESVQQEDSIQEQVDPELLQIGDAISNLELMSQNVEKGIINDADELAPISEEVASAVAAAMQEESSSNQA